MTDPTGARDVPEATSSRRAPERGIIPPDEPRRDEQPRVAGWPVAVAGILAAIGGIGFAVAYVLDAATQWLGAFLGLGLLGIAVGLGFWGRNLVADESGAEEYALPAEDLDAREVLQEELDADTRLFTRRWFLAAMLTLGVGTVAASTLFLVGSLGPRPQSVRFTTAWRNGKRLVDEDGRAVQRSALSDGGFIVVFPEGNTHRADSQVVLLRLPDLKPLPGRENWSPEGFLAFSRVCTHAGCPVAQYEDESQILLCPCHQSAFDIRQGAKPISGPAGRALPQLPLRIDADGYLVARSDFTEPVGPGFWNLP